MSNTDHSFDLDGLLEKLENVCRKLWEENRISAVPLQAVTNELKTCIRRAEESVSHLRHELGEREETLRSECDAGVSAAGKRAESAEARATDLEKKLAEARVRMDSLVKALADKEEQNAQFQEKYLKNEAKRDDERAAHMEEFIAEMETKEREREAFWKQRHQALESDFKEQRQELENEHRRLLEEVKKSADETGRLHLRKEAELMEAQKQFQAEMQSREEALRERGREYEQKYAEIEKLKGDLKAEISELTRQYRSGKELQDGR